MEVMLTIQPDWSDELKRQDGKAWISLKTRGEKGRHATLVSPNGRPQSASLDIKDEEAFRLEQATSSHLVVKTRDLTFKVIRPYATFQSIHPKGINSMDVSRGGLGVSVGDDT